MGEMGGRRVEMEGAKGGGDRGRAEGGFLKFLCRIGGKGGKNGEQMFGRLFL